MKKTAITLALSLTLLANSLPVAWAEGPGGNADQQWQRKEAQGQQEGKSDNRGQQRQAADNRQQPGSRQQGGEGQAPRQPNGQQNQGQRAAAPQRQKQPAPNNQFAYGGHDFRKGQPAPKPFRGNDYRVNDWRARGLPAPPRGQHWSYIDGRYVLIAAATGIITSIILNSALHH